MQPEPSADPASSLGLRDDTATALPGGLVPSWLPSQECMCHRLRDPLNATGLERTFWDVETRAIMFLVTEGLVPRLGRERQATVSSKDS